MTGRAIFDWLLNPALRSFRPSNVSKWKRYCEANAAANCALSRYAISTIDQCWDCIAGTIANCGNWKNA